MTPPTSSDSQIRDRLHSAVSDTTAPPAFAEIVMKRGRARRRRRYAAGTIAAAVVTISGAVLLQPDSPVAHDGQVATGGQNGATALRWAKSLPLGPAAKLPYFGEGGLHDAGEVVALPENVSTIIAPQRAVGGWLVALSPMETQLKPAILGHDGSIRALPAWPFSESSIDMRMAVSPDGSKIAYGDRVVDLATLDITEIPHNPANEPVTDPGWAQSLRIVDFTGEGLVYEGWPMTHGVGTHWLLADDGTTRQIDPPADSHISDGSPADVAVKFDYKSRTEPCVTSYFLTAGQWAEQTTNCLTHDIEMLDISPDGTRMLTGEPTQVWQLTDGAIAQIDMPKDLPFAGGWETNDTILIPIADRGMDEYRIGEDYDQTLQVVRCTVPIGTCERAGALEHSTVVGDALGTSEVRFN